MEPWKQTRATKMTIKRARRMDGRVEDALRGCFVEKIEGFVVGVFDDLDMRGFLGG
jgi:hypothetical protein